VQDKPAFTFKFGDSKELSDRLIQLVREGKKTATCGALREYGPGKEEMPVVGRQDMALNWDDTPALLLETVEIQHLRFCDVDEYFALAEGENETLPGWQRDHQAYFERTGGFDPEMVLVCERFRLVRDLEADPD
jgi:uncharacterized protein YhfF